jgi:hypothetical protein
MTERYCCMPAFISAVVYPFCAGQPVASQQVSFTDRPAALTAAERMGMKEIASAALEEICIDA